MKKIILVLASIIVMIGQHVLAGAPESFEKAKIALREKVYFDRQTSDVGDLSIRRLAFGVIEPNDG